MSNEQDVQKQSAPGVPVQQEPLEKKTGYHHPGDEIKRIPG
jgi:hypothetical protein